jgi:hydroxyacylglutathione hydrolase
MDVLLIPAFADNYIHLLIRDDAVGIVDPGDPMPVIAALDRQGLVPTHIFNTHHHADHIGGNATLKERFGCPIIAARRDLARIPGVDIAVGAGDRVGFGATSAAVIETPGHTQGHIAFHFDAEGALFAGDTLFSLGCGRRFEGSAEEMWDSLDRLRRLPGQTLLYCGHEYTESNARFALSIDGANPDLRTRAEAVAALRAEGRPTLPSPLDQECATNPFLRADNAVIQAAIGMDGGEPAAVFAELRRRKDHF